jgi:low temperature requirement protein LtrA
MSHETLLGHRRLRLAASMQGRDPNEEHRSSTPLELFFDLVFVVAVALASERLHHGAAEGAIASSIVSYALVFFAIYWAWVNFTWFASAYDTDDVVYRLFVFATIVGALIFASGVPRAFDQRDFTVVVAGYVVMRVVLISQWLRVAFGDAPRRVTAKRFAAGLSVLQLCWLAALLLPSSWWLAAWLVLAFGELTVPMWAEAASRTYWHNEHIAERYGLFMIIVLGESVLAASRAIQTVVSEGELTGVVVQIIVGGLLIVFCIWWTYFERPDDWHLASLSTAFVWSYLHLLVFASVAAVGAGLALGIEHATGHTDISRAAAASFVGVPLAVYLLSLWAMYVRSDDPPLRRFGTPLTAVVVIAGSFTPAPVLVIGILVAGLVVAKTAVGLSAEAPPP